jgi:hypothetical protein
MRSPYVSSIGWIATPDSGRHLINHKAERGLHRPEISDLFRCGIEHIVYSGRRQRSEDGRVGVIRANIPLVAFRTLADVDIHIIAPLVDNPGSAICVQRQIVGGGVAGHVAAETEAAA